MLPIIKELLANPAVASAAGAFLAMIAVKAVGGVRSLVKKSTNKLDDQILAAIEDAVKKGNAE